MENIIKYFKFLIAPYKWTLIFWACQVFYYGTITTIWYKNTPVIEGFTHSDWHKLITFVDFLTSLFLLGLIRFFIKKYVSIQGFNSSNVLTTFFIILVATLVWHPAHKGTGMLTHYFFGSPDIVYPKLFFKKSNYLILLSDFISVFSWVLTYLGAKLMIEIQANRVKKLELLVSIKRTQLQSLQNQINPHFLFNNLNNIRGLMLEDASKSKEMLHKLSEILSYNLSNTIEKQTSYIKDELEMLDCFIELCKIQLEDRFLFYKDINNVDLETEVPSMLFQILVENAVKHGVINIKKGGYVKVLIHQLNSELHIKVVNTSSSVQKKIIKNSGLLNLEKRLQLIYNGQANFSIDYFNKEVVSKISIPINSPIV